MCVRTENGYEMTDGTKIEFGANIANIQPKHIQELSEMPPSAWDFFIMMHTVDERLMKHNKACPVQPAAVQEIVDNRIRNLPRKVLKTSSETIKDATIVIMAGVALLKAFGVI